MMLTIHGLPTTTTYQDLKRMIKQECNIKDFILDNLVLDDDGCKKVRIGVGDDSDGSQLMKYLNGYHILGHVIRIVPIGKPGQHNHNYDARGNYQPRNEYNQGHNNFGNRPMGHDMQPPRVNAWVPNVQWDPAMPTPVQNTFAHQPQQPIQNSFVQAQGPRGPFVPGRVQGFGYPPKNTIPDRPIPPMKGNFPGAGQFEHQAPVPQGPFQGQAHVQPQPWVPQVQAVKPQFDKPGPGYNQMAFNDNRQMPKQGMINEVYKDYDKGDRRFDPQARGMSPGRRMSPRRRMSPGPQSRRMSPSGPPGRRMSPPGPQGRRMSPPGPHGRRMSPPGPQGRRMSPPGPHGRRMSPPGPQGRRISPPGSQGRRMSPPGPHGRRMSPPGSHGRRMSPPGPHGRKMSPPGPQGRRMSPPSGPHGRRMSPPGPQGRRMSPPGPHGRRMSPPGPHGRRMSPPGPHGRRMSPPGPQGRRMSPGPQGRRMSPPDLQGRRISPPGPHGRRMSPQGRRMSPGPLGPAGRRVSPPGPHPGRRISPGPQSRRMSPSRTGGPIPSRDMSPSRGRKMSPGPGRRMSPGYGRRGSPNVPHGRISPHGIPGRRMSPGRREASPGRRMSPTDRRMQARQSPSRRGSPRRMSPKRHSPGRRSVSPRHRSPLLEPPSGTRGYPPAFHQSKKPKYEDDDRPSHLKQVRPAYEPPTKAPNQAMYSGGYRPNVHENVQYPLPNTRSDPWQQNTDKPANYPPSKTLDSRIEKFDIPRVSEHLRMGDVEPKRSRSGTRDSRSPNRRDRSPFKDRYRRHSPSPRSPRRSWALEKRRSPLIGEAPPPPVWPGQNPRDSDFPRQNRPNFSDVPEKIEKKHGPSWERPLYEDKNDALRHDKGPDTFARNNPIHSEPVSKWKPISSAKESPRDNFRQDERFPENTRDSRNYGAKEQFGRQVATERMQYTDKRDFRDYPMKKDDRDELRQKNDIPPRRDDFSRSDDDRREIFRTNPAELNKEIEDVYKRVAELGKKAQEYRKKESRFEDRDDQFFNQNEDTMHRNRDRRDFTPDERFQGDKEEKSRQADDDENLGRQRESRWSTDKVWRPRLPLSSSAKASRERAAEELTRRIMNKFKCHISESQHHRVSDELQLALKRIFYDMFKNEDVSYIEIIIKFNKKYDVEDEKKIFEEVMSSFASNYRKRGAQDQPDIPAKTPKRSPDNLIKDDPKGIEFNNVRPPATQEWTLNVIPAVNLTLNPGNSSTEVPAVTPLNMQMPFIINPPPVMVPPPTYVPTFELPPHQTGLVPKQSAGFNLYLCKDNFQPFDSPQADELKSYLVSKMIEESETSHGWAPDFIMKGLQSVYRYEIVTQDERSRDWLLNLDFSNFPAFNVLVYTDEELWYERAAIWLPDHSRCRHIEPLQKLKLQNKKMVGVNVGKWKFVKKVVTVKGTRIYVDMPPSSARALDNYKMMISYELQKVSVFLKAMAVDKDVFDAGLNEPSIKVVPSMHYSAMPSLGKDANAVKIGLKGNKHASLAMTRKIKDMVVYQLYQYLLQGGNSSTDFVKYGFSSPGYLSVVPENTESKRWLVGLHIGALNRQPIIVIGGDDTNVKYIKMYIMLPNEHNLVNCAVACEKLKQSNQGVKGIKFGAWKNAKLSENYDGKSKLEVQMDLDSVEAIAKLNYELDYVDDRQDCLSVVVKSDYTYPKLTELIKQYRAEMTDSYDVANMDIETDSDDDVVCLN